MADWHHVDPGRFLRIILDPDPFRVAIRGHSAIDSTLTAAITINFEGNLPKEIKNLSFRNRVALGVAIGVVFPPGRNGLLGLGLLRNRFAHGEIETLTTSSANAAIDAFGTLVPPAARRQVPDQPLDHLRLALLAGMGAVERATHSHIVARTEERKILAAHYGRGQWQKEFLAALGSTWGQSQLADEDSPS